MVRIKRMHKKHLDRISHELLFYKLMEEETIQMVQLYQSVLN